jgi:hypothetical protein
MTDYSTNPYYKPMEERIYDLEAEVKELKRKVNNLGKERRKKDGE